MLNSPCISVIIPVYNAEKYLCECLDSIINQTLRDIEIICIDDGSTDNSFIIEQTLQEFDFFELIGVCFKYILIFLVGNR